MTSNSEEPGIKAEVSSDDEVLMESCNGKRNQYSADIASNSFENVLPEDMVEVQLLEQEETDMILDLSKPNKRRGSVTSSVKRPARHRKKCDDNTVIVRPIRKCTQNVENSDSQLSDTIQRIKIPIIKNFSSKSLPIKIRKMEANDQFGEKFDGTKKKNKKKTKKRLYPCRRCDAKFESGTELRAHGLGHEVQTRHKCDECGRCFNKAFSLRTHKRSHLTKEHKCELCVKTFPLRVDLRRHMRVHKRTVECDECEAMFHTREQLAKHVVKHTKDGEKSGCSDDQSSRKISGKVANKTKIEFKDVQNEAHSEDDGISDNSKCESKNDNAVFLRREDLNYATQVAIINKMYKGRAIVEICNIYNLTPDVVNEIWEDRDNFEKPKKPGVRTARYMNSILDTRILEWFNNQRENNVIVTGKMLQAVAESLAKEFGFVAFNGNMKWLERFKKKYNILLKSARVNRDYTNTESKWKTQFFKETWCDARLGVPDDNIYTADEVGLYFNPSKGRTKKITGKKFIQGHVKDRLSIFMCTNATGTDKKRLVVCGSEDPLLHSYRDPDTLPVTYIRHNEALFTTQVFENYVRSWNRELQMMNRKAILVLDRATIHSKLQFSNLKLVFVPWKTSGLIPIKNGIFGRFREEFRKLLLEDLAFNVIKGFNRNLTCLEALRMFEKAWNRVPADVITKSFIETGYDVSTSEIQYVEMPRVENDEDALTELLKDYDIEDYFTDRSLLDMYLTVEEELLTAQGTNVSVFGGNHKATLKLEGNKSTDDNLPIGTCKPESSENELFVRRARALEDLEIIRKCLQSNDTPFEVYKDFMEIENFVYRKQLNPDS